MQRYRFEFGAMASNNEIQLWASHVRAARAVADAAIAEVRRIEAKYSRYRADSVISAINAAAGGAPVAIDGETAALLEYGDFCHRASGGRFDLTSGVLRRAWDFRAEPPSLPDPARVRELLELVDWSVVERTPDAVRLPRTGMELDFGGIGKEYAADRAASRCLELGVQHALVNLGGDVRVVGPHPDGRPWLIAIRAPRGEGVAASVAVSTGALATSGDYERYFEIDGVRYSHLLDACTGYPASTWQSVSVLAPLCIVAGSLASLAMLAGDGAAALLRQYDVRYVAFDRRGMRRDGDCRREPAAFTGST